MVRHTQTICQQQPTDCLSVFDHFVELAFELLNENWSLFFKTRQLVKLTDTDSSFMLYFVRAKLTWMENVPCTKIMYINPTLYKNNICCKLI